MPRQKPKPEVPLVRTWPLNSEQHEAFVREYLDCYDGPKAALHAGFEKPLLVWQGLLEREDIQARLRGYKVCTDAPAQSASAILNHLLQSALAPRRKALITDIVTGQMRPNWEIVEEQDADFVEYDEFFQNKGGIHLRTTRFRKRGTLEAKKMVLQQLETLLQNSRQSGNPLTQAYMELSRKGSKAPIAKRVSNDEP